MGGSEFIAAVWLKIPFVWQMTLRLWVSLPTFRMRLAPLSSWTYSCELHKEELNDLYSSPNIIRVIQPRIMRRVGYVVAHMGERTDAYRVLVGKPVRKRQFGRLKLRWEDNIKIDVQEMTWECMEWIYLAQDRDRCRPFVKAVMNLQGSIKYGEFLV